MRNKLKRSNKVKKTLSKGKDQAQTSEVIVLVSESSCTDDETTQERRPTAAREERNPCGKGLKIAPIFTQRKTNKRNSDWSIDKRAEATQKPARGPKNNDVLESSPAASHLTSKEGRVVSSCRAQLSASALHSCLEEIQTSNPALPVQTVFSALQKKASERLQEDESAGHSLHPHSSQNPLKEKRKRENEISAARLPKRPRCSFSAEAGMGHRHLAGKDVPERSALTEARGSKLRLKQQSVPDSGLLKGSDTAHRDSYVEDVLWTDKYSPKQSSEVIGNAASVTKLLSWLKKWKLRADSDERRKMEEMKREGGGDDSWDCGDFQGEAGSGNGGQEPLCNTVLITGPSGVGKTATVYACAQELGFKVFEVNSSSQRSGRQLLSQLKEATQSHLVEISGKDPLKPAYFSNYTASGCTLKSEALPGKMACPKNATTTLKKRPARNSSTTGRKMKAKPAAVTLAHYFRMRDKADHFRFGGTSPAGKSPPDRDPTVPRSKKTATSLILFEEVDIVFEEDVGFLAAIKAFMTTTRRPVILTTSDPSFKERFDCSLEEIVFKAPSAVNVCSYLQLVCVAENARLDYDDASSLLKLTGGDVRRCLLQLQLWVHSGRGSASQTEGFPKESVCPQHLEAAEGSGSDAQLPPYQTGCSAEMLGLYAVTPHHLLEFLKASIFPIFPLLSYLFSLKRSSPLSSLSLILQHGSRSEMGTNKLLKLLSESWRRGVPLLYSNFELLLSLGGKGTSAQRLHKVSDPWPQSEPRPSGRYLHTEQLNRNICPEVRVTYGASVSSRSRLSRKKPVVCDAQSSSSLTNKPQRTTSSSNATPTGAQSSSEQTNQKADKGQTDCLDALKDFYDLMSYVDTTLSGAGPLVSGSRMPETFVWTGAAIKDGLLDEVNEDETGSRSQGTLLDIKAAVEGLGCRLCWRRVSETWTEDLEDKRWERRTTRASAERQSLSFTFRPLCAPCVSQRRFRLSRMVHGSKGYSLLGNRQAISVDYMPFLRSIWRSTRALQQKGEPTRCQNYLSSSLLGLSKSTMELLAEDFTLRNDRKNY
ncbi:ATPase family AAA domain-containing protein 5b isoform 2-T2 [Odontesthes bonariensis]|uniref:ATPase family AAA domain-containing protein 5b isoform X2 n=1 Tax=Odontesthes bonariensis TaxID=219752 RepID=UPI003F58C5E5